MSEADYPQRGLIYSWTMAPCFLKCLSRAEESDKNELDIYTILFLLKKSDLMRLVIDNDTSIPSFLHGQYQKIFEEICDAKLKQLVELWFDEQMKNNRIKHIKTEDFPPEYKEILAKVQLDSQPITDCFKRCIVVSRCSKDKLLLIKNQKAIRENRIDKQFGINVFNLEEAEKVMSSPEDFESSSAIQSSLIKPFLWRIKHQTEVRESVIRYYKDNSKRELRREEDVGEQLFNYLEDLFGRCNLNCDTEVKLGNGRADAIISSGRYKVVIELKYSHKDIENGLVAQLTDYLDRKDTLYGIFLVLYSSSVNSGKSIEEKKTELEGIKIKYAEILSKYKIETFWIDCSARVSPSRRKANSLS